MMTLYKYKPSFRQKDCMGFKIFFLMQSFYGFEGLLIIYELANGGT